MVADPVARAETLWPGVKTYQPRIKVTSKRDATYNRRIHLKSKYGITPEQYEKMRTDQEFRCMICRKCEDEIGKLVIDHCHKSGKVRGLLCGNCNKLIGLAREDPRILRSAQFYVMLSRALDYPL